MNLRKCPRCWAEAEGITRPVMDIETNETVNQCWVACTKCEFSSGHASDMTLAASRWNGTAPAADVDSEPTSSLDQVGPDELFREKLIEVLIDISKSLRTLVSKR